MKQIKKFDDRGNCSKKIISKQLRKRKSDFMKKTLTIIIESDESEHKIDCEDVETTEQVKDIILKVMNGLNEYLDIGIDDLNNVIMRKDVNDFCKTLDMNSLDDIQFRIHV